MKLVIIIELIDLRERAKIFKILEKGLDPKNIIEEPSSYEITQIYKKEINLGSYSQLDDMNFLIGADG